MTITTPIIPTKQYFAKTTEPHQLDLKAICVFGAIGFFLDTDTYFKDEVVLKPACNHKINEDKREVESSSYFEWHYSPRNISFNQALEEFTELFESIIKEQVEGKKVILPLSGGLDSRTQAAALKAIKADVFSYSYDFKNGYRESKIAKAIAKACHFPFESYTITSGYLWDNIEKLSELNQFYADFTSPRQMAVVKELIGKGDVFSLGHWGDVLFDSMNLPQLPFEKEVEVLMQKLLKKGGLEFAKKLWRLWQIEGSFEAYFRIRIEGLLSKIHIKDTNAKFRAFKSLYWAARWTTTNLSIFESVKPIMLPYYHNKMCEFICSIPEDYLKNRKLQIAYIKSRAPELATITWQDQRPFNLNNYYLNKFPLNLPYKILNKLKREANTLFGRPYVQRNWELQFLGKANKEKLCNRLLKNTSSEFLSKTLIEEYLNAFYNRDSLENAHAINMLLVLSEFNKKIINE